MYYLLKHPVNNSKDKNKNVVYEIISPNNKLCSSYSFSLKYSVKSLRKAISSKEELEKRINNSNIIASAATLDELLDKVPELLL